MLPEVLHDRAALYVAGAMTADQRETFELLLEFHGELRAHVARLQEVGAAVAVAALPRLAAPPPSLKDRVLQAVQSRPQTGPEPMVVTNPSGLVEWVNPQFLALCGHEFHDLRGRKPGHVLQGPDTDRKVVEEMRAAIRERRRHRTTLLNYHRDGSRYLVDVCLTPVLDDDGEPLCFVARERKIESVA